jgi:hypothetical protein
MAIPAVGSPDAFIIVAPHAKLLPVMALETGLGKAQVIDFPVEGHEFRFVLADGLLPPIQQQFHMRSAHVADWRDTLLFVRGQDKRRRLCSCVRSQTVPHGARDERKEYQEAGNDPGLVTH